MDDKLIKEPSLLDSLLPIVLLIIMMGGAVFLFGSDSSFGPNQIALLTGMFVASVIGLKNGHTWKSIEKGVVKGISMSLGACLILMAVGSLIGTWMLAGTVPTLIYYGLALLNPSLFYAAACLVCAIVAMSIGSSWTTAATVGVALIGVATGMDMSLAITAGAIISGAYFGDKLSPLSETTNLAPAIAGTDLFEHIKYMLWTTVPSFVIAMTLFIIIGFQADTSDAGSRIAEMRTLLDDNFNIAWYTLIPLFVLLTLAINKMPAFPAVAIGAVVGGIWAVLFQQELVLSMIDSTHGNALKSLQVVWIAMFDGVSFSTGNEDLDSLLSRGGMSNMLNTIWLIICAMSFGAVLESVGLLKSIVSAILKGARSAGDMVSRTILTCIGTNIVTADQYISIVMPGRMYKEEYQKRDLHQLNLSRSLEDGGTITSPLIPWNTCGAYMHGVLQVNPLDYIYYAFFNLINPILAVIYAYFGIKILRLTPPKIEITR
ncbi:Na+/H+ antiporter NhaC [Agaribacter flavus]|uniref:Na+/H+ antiporter NhaC n=1 Tax=Agaribacter flavus TaxID=1902781 RepID=A0ABV7FQG0_9ALTE